MAFASHVGLHLPNLECPVLLDEHSSLSVNDILTAVSNYLQLQNYRPQLPTSSISQLATEHPVRQREGQGIQVQLTKKDELLLTCTLIKRTQIEQKRASSLRE